MALDLYVYMVVALALANSQELSEDARERDRKEIVAIARGEQAALGRVCDRYQRLVYGLALRILRDAPGAEEVAQDVFLRLWHRASDFDPMRGDLIGWLVTVTRNRAIDRLRSRQQRESSVWSPMPAVPDTAGWLATESTASSFAIADALRGVLALLSDPERQMVELAYYEGYSQSEIADRLKMPLGTVKTWTRNALQKMRQAMQTAQVQGSPS